MHHVACNRQVKWQKAFDSCESSFWLTRKWCILQHVLRKLFLDLRLHLLEHKNLQKYMATWQTHELKKRKLISFTLPGMLGTKVKALIWWQELNYRIYWVWMPVIQSYTWLFVPRISDQMGVNITSATVTFTLTFFNCYNLTSKNLFWISTSRKFLEQAGIIFKFH